MRKHLVILAVALAVTLATVGFNLLCAWYVSSTMGWGFLETFSALMASAVFLMTWRSLHKDLKGYF
jgi:hypothetical protein